MRLLNNSNKNIRIFISTKSPIKINKNEFKSLFFDKIRLKSEKFFTTKTIYKSKKTSLFQKQMYSFIAAYINHQSIRPEIADELNRSELFDDSLSNLLKCLRYSFSVS